MWRSPEGQEGQLALTPRRCSTGYLKYQQCVLEKYESDTQYHNTPVQDQWPCITQLFSILSPRCLQTRIRRAAMHVKSVES
ncbi:hypothetical protein TNCV_1285251 [Trichonephila clavipes]|uniref:Uncharacterized protein n=1 Tax=Trichonephila clavipes TaxID=2585209 RepID=A0A8X6SQK3_TRICX|nr:hypothetical protein TNCV_1285251 [Trichonephila clavipes]